MNLKYIYVDLIQCNYNPIKWLCHRIKGLKNNKIYKYPEIQFEGDKVKTIDNTLYDVNSCNLDILHQVDTEYKYDDIRPDDILMDIGANVGMFCLRLRDKVAQVYAVEPLFFEELNKNVVLNNARNKVWIIPCGLGAGYQEVTFGSVTRFIECKTLTQLFELMDDQITFLKLDCEGGEWCIKPEELKDIRRIEAEVHNFNGHDPLDFVNMLVECRFKVMSEIQTDGMMMVHAYR